MTLPAARAVSFTGDRRAELEWVELSPPGPGEVAVRTELSAVSAGTELLFYRGAVDPGVDVDTALPGYREPARYPLRYGYAAVGRIVALGAGVDRARLGRRVFAYRPHQEAFVCGDGELVDVPGGLDPVRAALLATMETAVTLLLDAAPRIGERVAVIGQGAVGMLTAALAARSLASTWAIDPVPARLELARALSGARATFCTPGDAAALAGSFDVAIELSARPAGMQLGLDLLCPGGRLVVGSWYAEPVPLSLDARIHRSRHSITFSQVSRIAPELWPRFDRARRHAIAFDWLGAVPVDAMITHRVPLADAPAIYRELDERPAGLGQIVLVHSWEGPCIESDSSESSSPATA